jgi:hypothetical protein
MREVGGEKERERDGARETCSTTAMRAPDRVDSMRVFVVDGSS